MDQKFNGNAQKISEILHNVLQLVLDQRKEQSDAKEEQDKEIKALKTRVQLLEKLLLEQIDLTDDPSGNRRTAEE